MSGGETGGRLEGRLFLSCEGREGGLKWRDGVKWRDKRPQLDRNGKLSAAMPAATQPLPFQCSVRGVDCVLSIPQVKIYLIPMGHVND